VLACVAHSSRSPFERFRKISKHHCELERQWRWRCKRTTCLHCRISVVASTACVVSLDRFRNIRDRVDEPGAAPAPRRQAVAGAGFHPQVSALFIGDFRLAERCRERRPHGKIDPF